VARVAEQLRSIAPALLFLLAGVPLAAGLDALGFFDAVAARITRHREETSVLALWILAAVTTVVLNLDTTVVLLTPLYVRLARRGGRDPLALAAVPLLLACLASSVLPVSNLTTLIVVSRFDLSVAAVVTHLALPSLAATTVGWLCYRRLHPTTIPSGGHDEPDERALRLGGAVVAFVLVGFVFGPVVGIPPWAVALGADGLLVVVTRVVPWRSVPVTTAIGVAAVAAAAAVFVPADLFTQVLAHDQPAALALLVGLATVVANVINSLPALLVAIDGADQMSWGLWAWLLGVNTGAVLLPIGALANLLWWRILRTEEVAVSVRTYVRLTVPVALPALLAATAVLAIERVVAGP
jgi:arsenical pump membrane protein